MDYGYGYPAFGGAAKPFGEQSNTTKSLLVSGVLTCGVAVVLLFGYMNEMNKEVAETDKANQEKKVTNLLYFTVLLAVIGAILLYFYTQTQV